MRVSWTKWPSPILITSTPKSLKLLSAFLNLYEHAKNQFIPSTNSWDKVNFIVLWPGWPHPPLTMTTPEFFDQLLIYVNLCQCVKNQAISLICSGKNGWLKNPAIWLAENMSAHVSGTKIFSNIGYVQENSKYYKFSL